MEFKELINKAKSIRDQYTKIETKVAGKPWGLSERVQGFVGDVGDLTKLIMAKNGLRKYDDLDNKINHELVDCLWSIIIIADELGIDLEKEFFELMEDK